MKWQGKTACCVMLGLFVFLTGCQSAANKDKAADAAKNKKSASELFVSHIEKDGDKLLCEQPAYLKCFRMTPTKCRKDLSQFKQACLSEALQKHEGKITDANYKQFGNDYSLCMLVKHALMYPKRAEAIGQCLDQSRFANKPTTN